jgi:hypothetical protein
MQRLACRTCGYVIICQTAEPPFCRCGNRHWRNAEDPITPYEITLNDRRLLKSLRIQSEEPKG